MNKLEKSITRSFLKNLNKIKEKKFKIKPKRYWIIEGLSNSVEGLSNKIFSNLISSFFLNTVL